MFLLPTFQPFLKSGGAGLTFLLRLAAASVVVGFVVTIAQVVGFVVAALMPAEGQPAVEWTLVEWSVLWFSHRPLGLKRVLTHDSWMEGGRMEGLVSWTLPLCWQASPAL